MSNAIQLPNAPAILTIAVSTRALFQLELENAIFDAHGEDAFNQHMLQTQTELLERGPAFALVKKLLSLNQRAGRKLVDVCILSRNSPNAGLRVMNSIRHYGLGIERAVFTRGSNRFRYAKGMGADLFLSANQEDVAKAIESGVAAATMLPASGDSSDSDGLRAAFDGDSVLFGSESDLIFKTQGLDVWRDHEKDNANVPLSEGPFKCVAEKLHQVREALPAEHKHLIRIALVTARGAPAHERALKTLMSWGIVVDEAVFSAGAAKGPLLAAFEAHIFFDDGAFNIHSAQEFQVPSGLVPSVAHH